nr:hypothetical protein [Tanacetum cinerariifolium]
DASFADAFQETVVENGNPIERKTWFPYIEPLLKLLSYENVPPYLKVGSFILATFHKGFLLLVVNELVSTHGYSQNQIILCRYPLARVNQAWTGLPRGVKFDPLDHQIIWHLLAKSGASGFQPNPSTDECIGRGSFQYYDERDYRRRFIPTVVKDEGISYIHPQKFPGGRDEPQTEKVDDDNSFERKADKKKKWAADNLSGAKE